MFYTNYRGQTVGRILGYLEECCDLRVAEEATVGHGYVEHLGKQLAIYKWEDDSDRAIIEFVNKWHRRTYLIKRHFIDNRELLANLEYTIQEMSRYIKYNLGSDELIKRRLKDWWFLATDQNINQYYDTLKDICITLNKDYYSG